MSFNSEKKSNNNLSKSENKNNNLNDIRRGRNKFLSKSKNFIVGVSAAALSFLPTSGHANSTKENIKKINQTENQTKNLTNINSQEKENSTIFNSQNSKEIFPNGEKNLFLEYKGEIVGEFSPIKKGIKILNSKNTNLKEDLETILSKYPDASGIIPGALTDINFVSEGINVSNGEIFGNEEFKNYGIIYTENGKINFTHSTYFNNDKNNFKQTLLKKVINEKENLLFLPSIYREGNLNSNKGVGVQHCLVRRITPSGEQIGVVKFKKNISYQEATDIVKGLDRAGKSETTHIYYLDAGAWSENVKRVNGDLIKTGERNINKVTNYIIFK